MHFFIPLRNHSLTCSTVIIGQGIWNLRTFAVLVALVCLTACHSKQTNELNSKMANTNLFAPPETNATPASAPTPAASTNAPTSMSTDVRDQLRAVYTLDAQKKYDEAMTKVNSILQADPKNSSAYILRGDIYSKQKLYDQAAKDYETVLQIVGPSSVAKFNLSELKFIQKQYDDARPGFLAMEGDADLGDLATYKVFLCDLFAPHDDAAQKEFDDFNKVGGNASYYFANVAWNVYHKKPDDARTWLDSAMRIYPSQKVSLYSSSLQELGYLPLPPPAAPAN
jgi:tetratricopeptide (TPR) repeat protein